MRTHSLALCLTHPLTLALSNSGEEPLTPSKLTVIVVMVRTCRPFCFSSKCNFISFPPTHSVLNFLPFFIRLRETTEVLNQIKNKRLINETADDTSRSRSNQKRKANLSKRARNSGISSGFSLSNKPTFMINRTQD